MHKKVIQKLHKLKEELTENCTTCYGSGCIKCSSQYDLYERMAHADIPLRYWDFELSSLKNDIKGVKHIKSYLNKLDLAYDEGQGVFAYGKNGNGKTLCACIIAKEALKKGYEVRFTNLGNVISAFTDSMYDSESKQKLKNDILEVDFLILDDVDKAYLSKDSRYIDSVLDTLFRFRVQNCLPVVMTANQTMEAILSSQGEVFCKSLLSLFDESLLPILFMGSDHRTELKKSVRERYLKE